MFEIKDLFSKKQLVGLDIGSSSLKLVEISNTSKGYALDKFYQIPLDRSVIVDGVLNEPDTLSQSIKELFKLSNCKVKNVVASLSGHSVVVKKVNFPNMEENELRVLISDEAEKYLPFDDTKEFNFDFQILGESDINPNLMDVILVAAEKEIIDSYSNAIQTAGLKVIIMDLDSFALETMYEANYDFEEGDTVVLVNIGASITNINVVKNGVSMFTRDFPMGGNNITEAMRVKMGVTFEEAEAAKLKAEKTNEAEGNDLEEDLLNYVDPLLMEIERSVDYFGSTYRDESIKKILISGGCAKIKGLTTTLFQRLNIETETVNPFKNISYNQKKFDPSYIEDISPIAAVGVGLALRRPDDK